MATVRSAPVVFTMAPRRGPTPDGPRFEAHCTIGPAGIAAPHDFGFQLRHYVIPPEWRNGPMLVEVVRTASGALVRVDVSSTGSVERPELALVVQSHEPLGPADADEVRGMVMWRLGTDDDLRPFYALVQDDPVLSASIEHNFGAKAKCSFSMFDALVDVICAQNTAFRRLYQMRTNLAVAFGDAFAARDHVFHASPRPEQLAAAPLDAIRDCGVGYRDKYIKGVAEAVVGGFDVEGLKHRPGAEARARLMELPGVGPYTADLGLVIGARRQDTLFLDVFLREVLRAFYFSGEQVTAEALARFAEDRWGPYRGYAWFYLTTNTEIWAPKVGVRFRLRSGALSDPDGPR